MNDELNISKHSNPMLSMHPKKFALWLFMATVIMMFGGLTSAFIVGTSSSILDIALPEAFTWSSIVIVISSVTMQWAIMSAKKDELNRLKLLLGITLALGLGFLYSQVLAFEELQLNNIDFRGEKSGSFIYIFAGLHGFHVISAIVFLFVVVINGLRMKIHAKNLAQIEMCTSYWHFLGGLWIYLYIFLLLNFN